MDTPFIGEIRAFNSDIAPEGWLRCDGTLHKATHYQALARVVGGNFGGNGISDFGVPKLEHRSMLNICIAYAGEWPARLFPQLKDRPAPDGRRPE